LTVEDVSSQTIRMRVHGSVVLAGKGNLRFYPTGKIVKELENRYDARLEGVLGYDRAQKRIAKSDMDSLGDYTGTLVCHKQSANEWREATSAAPLPLCFSFELDCSDYEGPAARRRPKSFVHSYVFRSIYPNEEFYWDPDKWEEDWKKKQPK